jgi:hypothetical protein
MVLRLGQYVIPGGKRNDLCAGSYQIGDHHAIVPGTHSAGTLFPSLTRPNRTGAHRIRQSSPSISDRGRSHFRTVAEAVTKCYTPRERRRDRGKCAKWGLGGSGVCTTLLILSDPITPAAHRVAGSASTKSTRQIHRLVRTYPDRRAVVLFTHSFEGHR